WIKNPSIRPPWRRRAVIQTLSPPRRERWCLSLVRLRSTSRHSQKRFALQYTEETVDRTFDPILVEVVKNELAAITEEMAIAVWKTGRSAMMKTGDFATAMCDGQGRLIGQGYAAPFQLAFFIEMMPYIINK